MAKAASYYRYSKTINLLLCITGLLVSTYAYYVEFNKEKDSDFVAMCDISAFVSCSKVFTSRYIKIMM